MRLTTSQKLVIKRMQSGMKLGFAERGTVALRRGKLVRRMPSVHFVLMDWDNVFDVPISTVRSLVERGLITADLAGYDAKDAFRASSVENMLTEAGRRVTA